MGPKKPDPASHDDLFRNRLENLIDQRHELVRLAELIDWSVFDREWGPLFFAEAGAPARPTRLMAGLLYLKHLYKLSDEAVVERWEENPYWQYFCGEEYFQHEPPVHPTSMTRWRQRIGEEGCEWLLTQTIEAARSGGFLKRQELQRVSVDTTVQEKAVAFPTDSRLYDAIRRRLVAHAKHHDLQLRQNYNRKAKHYLRKINGYGHAKQYRRMHRTIKKYKNRVGRVLRDLERQIADRPDLQILLAEDLALAHRILSQQRHDKGKVYSVHAPEVECISKGKVHKRYEFGVKASVATTNKSGFVVGARSYPLNPYDGHTLQDQLQQVETLTGVKVERCYVDRGYRGHGVTDTPVYIAGQRRGITPSIKRELKRRSAIEPEIGHMKNDGHLGRCYLKGQDGDAMNVLLAACGHNLRKVLARLRAFWLRILWRYIDSAWNSATPSAARTPAWG